MKNNLLSVFFILCASLYFMHQTQAQSQINAKVVTFEIPGATSTYITCTNDSNDFGGYYIMGSNTYGFFYNAKAVDTIFVNYPGAVNTWVHGINNHRVVVGSFNTTGNIADDNGFKYDHSVFTFSITTNWLGHTFKVSRDINDNNCIVGDHRTNPTTSVGHILCSGSDTLFHYNYNSSFVRGMNNAASAVGFWMDAPYNYGFIRHHNGTFTNLNYPGATRTRLTGINDSNMVVGTYDLYNSFVYKNGVFKKIVKAGVADFQVQDINNYGFIVGYYKNASNNFSGFYMPYCDIGFRPNPDGWSFDNSEANMWPESHWQQFDYNSDPYRYGQATFPKVFINGAYHTVQNFLFPDWKMFVETFGENYCYNFINNIPYVKNTAFNKWFAYTEVWGGSCFGFTQSAFMVWDDIQQFKSKYPFVGTWSANNILYELPVNHHNRYCINQLQIKQSQKHMYRFYNQHITITPNQSLIDFKKSLLDGNKDEGGLIVFNQNPGGGGHIVCPYKIEIDTLDPSIEYIYVYDNNQPADTTRRVKVDKNKNAWYYNLSGNAGIPQSEWGGDHAHKGMFLCKPASTFYQDVFVDSLKKFTFAENEKNNTFDIFNSKTSNITFTNQGGDVTSYINDVFTNNIQGVSPMFHFMGNQPPFGYSLPEAFYNVEMKDFSNPLVNFSLITNNDNYYYSRSNALLNEKDAFQINTTGIRFLNNDINSKHINVHAINEANAEEKAFFLYELPLHQNSNMHFSILNNDKLKLVNEGVASKYNLKIQYSSTSNAGTFEHDSIIIAANTTHIINVNWATVQNADVCIYIDNGNNGFYNDTLCFANQGTPVLATNPTIISLNAALVNDTVFIGNLGSGNMTWNVLSDATAWLNITGNSTGANFGHITYAASANTGAERTAHIIITAAGASNSPYLIEVKQAGVLSAPQNLTASDGTFSDGVHLTWAAAPNATHYKVYRNDVAGSNGSALTGWITNTSYVDNTANGGDFYYYSVKAAQNASGLNETGFSNTDDGWRACFTANFIYSDACAGQPSLLTSTSSVHTPAFYLWDIDNNGTIDYTGPQIHHTFATTGTKTVKLTVTDSSLCVSTVQKDINVLAFGSINLPDSTVLCAWQSLTLNAGSGFSSYLWSNGATTASVTLDSTGYGLGSHPIYVLASNANGCSTIDTSIVTWNICTEAPNIKLRDFAVNIYPNPTNNFLNISIEGHANDLSVEMFSFNGQLVYSDKVSAISGHYKAVIDTKSFKQGIYFIRCISENRVVVNKVIVF